jgi:hypothetical protein
VVGQTALEPSGQAGAVRANGDDRHGRDDGSLVVWDNRRDVGLIRLCAAIAKCILCLRPSACAVQSRPC